MLGTVLTLVIVGLAALMLLAFRWHWWVTDRTIDRAEADHARIDRAALRRRLGGGHHRDTP
ncbi:hypothetical protein [Catenuloplanes japonicus]|uniref:hypothetical protein n=1 Tax=Catenuloplanes japonicus TaxID=33876 RepID=UPI000527C1EB|nr:hypothetical protein [Catenuloplanes japonicus]